MGLVNVKVLGKFQNPKYLLESARPTTNPNRLRKAKLFEWLGC